MCERAAVSGMVAQTEIGTFLSLCHHVIHPIVRSMNNKETLNNKMTRIMNRKVGQMSSILNALATRLSASMGQEMG